LPHPALSRDIQNEQYINNCELNAPPNPPPGGRACIWRGCYLLLLFISGFEKPRPLGGGVGEGQNVSEPNAPTITQDVLNKKRLNNSSLKPHPTLPREGGLVFRVDDKLKIYFFQFFL